MTLQQLADIKHWYASHPLGHLVEQQVWDGVLASWVMGWAGLPAAWLLDSIPVLLLCGAMLFTPGLYVGLRQRLHRRGVLRCDWLGSTRSG